MAKKRKLDNWLKGLLEYVEDTEAPRFNWLWAGLFTISAALQRKVWIPYGIDTIFPNLYVCFVARPGERKGAPIAIAKRMLETIMVPVSVDSTSTRKMTKELAKSAETEQFMHPDGKPRRMSTMAVISKELGSLLAIDRERMIIALTDLFDCHESWKYDTSDKGHDFLYNVCLQVFAATTPRYLVNNLPPEAFGEGFASRVAWISERPTYKSVPWPKELDVALYKTLIADLHIISKIVGEFKISPEAKEVFDAWYHTLKERKKTLRDDRLYGNLNRLHILVLKVAMILRVAKDSELLIDLAEINHAIELMEDVLETTPLAFGGSGMSRLGPMTEAIRQQIKILGSSTMKELMQMNYRNVSKNELEEILNTLEIMGEIERPVSTCGPLDQVIRRVKVKKD